MSGAPAPSVSGTPRRSSRASIAPDLSISGSASKSKSKTVPVKKPATKKARGRTASPVEEDSDEEDSDDEGSVAGSRKRKAPAKAAAPRKKAAKVTKSKTKPKRAAISGMNPIADRFDRFPLHSAFDFDVPALAAKEEAPRTAFVFGNGDMGQHGMGWDADSDDEDAPKKPKVLVEISRPRLHTLIEEKIGRKEKGWEQGIASLECGGMHTLAVDGDGKVWSWGWVLSSL